MYKIVRGAQAEKPAELEFGKTTVYKRRNIQSVTETDEDGKSNTFWQYEEEQMTFREYTLEIARNSL